MKASIGRIVHYTMPPGQVGTFGTDKGQSQTVPAIIVQVWADDCVNLRVFPDSAGQSYVETSVPLKNDNHNQGNGFYWEWPSRD